MSTETSSLDDILKRDEQGRFSKREDPAADTPAIAEAPTQPIEQPAAALPPSGVGDKQTGPSPVPEKVESDEVKGLKAELARLRQRNRETAQPVRQPDPIKPPSVFEDEEGFTRHVETNVSDMVFEQFLAMSEDIARERFPDFAEVMGTDSDGENDMHVNWLAAVRKDPSLFGKFRQARNPAAFAYQELKRQRDLEEIGDPKAYREKLRKEIEAEFQAKQGLQPQQQSKPEPNIPDTLAGSASKAARQAPDFSGPKPLNDIFASAPHMQPRQR